MVIKELDLQNPFANYGNIVKGKYFVGRKEAIIEIQNRVLGESYGNLAIAGLPRVGKTSLAWNSLMVQKDTLSKKGHFISYINVGSLYDTKEFYLSIVVGILDELESLGKEAHYQRLFSIYQQARKAESEIYEFKSYIGRFFRKMAIFNLRATYVLDEFDHASKILNEADFQFFRDVISLPVFNVCFVTVSRQTLQEIEPENGTNSNFYGVFSDLHLRLFHERDIQAYWQRITDLGIGVSEDYKNKVKFFVGNHPYWMDMVNYRIFNGLKNTDRSAIELLSEADSELKRTLWDNYDDIIGLLDKEGLKNDFIQAVISPMDDVSQISLERLIEYGIVSPVPAREKYNGYYQNLIDEGLAHENDIVYESISTHFNDYLRQNGIKFGMMTSLSSVEHGLRNLITVRLKEKYGDDWLDPYIGSNPDKINVINRIKAIRARYKESFGSAASDSLISYTNPTDLWNCFISTDWTWFHGIFGEKQAEWRDKFTILGRVRNSILNNFQEDQKKMKEICNEILIKIEAGGV